MWSNGTLQVHFVCYFNNESGVLIQEFLSSCIHEDITIFFYVLCFTTGVKFMFVKSEHHTREQEEKMKFESQIFLMTPRFKENWSCPVVTIKSVTNATALDS